MKKRLIALLCCLCLVFSVLPSIRKVKAEEKTNAKRLDTAEEAVKVLNQKAQSNVAKMKGKVTAAQKNDAIRSRLIVKTSNTIENTYGANDIYYYTIGKYQILFYSSAKKAGNACEKIKKDMPGITVFQDMPVTLKDSARDVESSTKDGDSDPTTAYNGIKLMGMDKLKEQEDIWKDKKATVAVIDSGIKSDHEWFKTRLDRERSTNFARDNGNQGDSSKPKYYDGKQGHGSHVSGIITQATPEEVKIMAVRVFDATGSASYEIITMAVDYAVEQKADVINMSLGFEIAPGYENAQTELMDEAFARAMAAKTTVCAASGNEYTDTARSYPASSPWTIAVGSLEPDQSGSGFIRSDFSNNGTLLDFVGPGRYIYSAWGAPNPYTKENEYEDMLTISGTSMATPHLAAAVAYVKMKHPDYNQQDVYATFRDNAIDLGDPGKDTEFGYGYVNLAEYVTKESKDGKEYQAINAPAKFTDSMSNVGKEINLGIKLSKGDGKLTYESTDENVVKVSDGKLTVVGAGTCNIVVKAAETDAYKETEQTIAVKIEKGQQTIKLPTSEIKKHLSDKPFKVEAQIEAPGDGNIEFITNENDVLSVTKDGMVTIHKTGTARIYAIATSTKDFNREISDAIVVTVVNDEKEQKPANDSKADDKKQDNTNTTTKTKTENIAKPAQSEKIKVGKVSVKKIKAGKKKFNISWKKQSAVTGYQIRYSTKKDMKKSKTVTSLKKATTKTVKKLKSKKRYYVQVRAYKSNGNKKIYGSWSTKKTVKVH